MVNTPNMKDVQDAAITSVIVLGSVALLSKVPQVVGIIPEFDVAGVTLFGVLAGGVGLLVREAMK